MVVPCPTPGCSATLGGFTLLAGQRVWVPEPGTYRSYVEAQSVIQLVDNDQLDWERPSAWERLTGEDEL